MATRALSTLTAVAIVAIVLGLAVAPGVATATDDANETLAGGIDDTLENTTDGTVDAVTDETTDALDSGATQANETASDGATTSNGEPTSDDESTDGGETTADGETTAGVALSADGTASSIDANGSLSADADEPIALDATAAAEDGDDPVLDTSLETTVGDDGATLGVDANVGDGTIASITAGLGEANSNQGSAEPADAASSEGEGDRREPGAADTDDADGGTDDDAPGGTDRNPAGSLGSGAGAGLALGSVLGGGVLARRFVTGPVATGGAGGGSSLVSMASAWLRAWGWRVAALVGYQRYDGSDPLEHETRETIHERIEAEPGICLTELADAVDVPLSTLRYHLRILAHEELIDSEKVRGKRRYTPTTTDRDPLAPALEDDATAAVLEAVASEPDSVSGLADRLDRDPSTVTHHLQRLDEVGLVEREREGRSVVSRLADDVDPTDVVGAAPTPAD